MSSPKLFKSGKDALLAANNALHNVAAQLVPGSDDVIPDWDPKPDEQRVADIKEQFRQKMRKQFAADPNASNDGG